MNLYERINYTFQDVFLNNGTSANYQEKDKTLLAVSKLFEPFLQFENLDEPYVPLVFINNEKCVFQDLDTTDIDLIKRLDTDKLNNVVRSRIGDVLWFKNKDEKLMKLAIEAYKQLISEMITDDPEEYGYIRLMSRVLIIIQEQSKDTQLKKDFLDFIRIVENKLFNSSFAAYLSLLQWQKKYSLPIRKDILNQVKSILDDLKDFGLKVQLIEFLIINVKKEEKQKYKELYAQLVLEMSEDVTDYFLVEFITKGLKYTKNDSLKNKLTKKYHEIYQHGSQSMQEWHCEEKIKTNQFIKNLNHLTPQETLRRWGMAVKAIKFNTLIEHKESFFSGIFRTEILYENGMPAYTLAPKDNNNKREWEMHDFTDNCSSYALMYTKPLIDHLKTFGDEGFEVLKKLVNTSSFIKASRKDIVYTGLCYVINGDQFIGLNLLLPQFEAALRNHIEINDGTVYEIKEGRSEYKTGHALIEEVQKYLNPEDVFLVENIFSIQGINVRNLLMHGISEPASVQEGKYYAFLAIFMNFVFISSYSNEE